MRAARVFIRVVLVSALLPLGSLSSASAERLDNIPSKEAQVSDPKSEDQPLRRPWLRVVRSIENKTVQHGARGPVLGYCIINAPNSTCTVTHTSSVSNSIGVGLGASVGWVAANLGIESSRTVSVSTSCTSPRLAKGTRYNAYSSGTRYNYKIRKKVLLDGFTRSNEVTGPLTAFRPDAGGVHCGG